MARYIFMRYGFLMSCSFVWFAFMALPYLIAAVIVHLIPLDLGGGDTVGRPHIFALPFVILGFVSASVAAGVYYIVGRKVLRFLGLWDDELAELSFKQFRYYRRGYRVTPRARRKGRNNKE